MVDPTQPGIPAAAYTDRSAQTGTPAVTPSPLQGVAQAPAGVAGYTTQRRSVRKEIQANVTRVADLAKHASDAGLLGVAEAAGRALGELTPASGWRQELLQIRVVAGLLLTGMLGELVGPLNKYCFSVREHRLVLGQELPRYPALMIVGLTSAFHEEIFLRL